MARSLLQQFSQGRGSISYRDDLTLSLAESAGHNKTLSLGAGTSSGQTVTIAGAAFVDADEGNILILDGSPHEIASVSSSTVVVIDNATTPPASFTTADLHYYQNVEDDFNYLRTKIRDITGETNWYDESTDSLTSLRSDIDAIPTTFSGLPDTESGYTEDQVLFYSDSGVISDAAFTFDPDTHTFTLTDGSQTEFTAGPGGMTLSSGVSVDQIVGSITEPGVSNALVTESGIVSYVAAELAAFPQTYLGLTDTFIGGDASDSATYTANNMLYTSSSGVHDTSSMTFDVSTGDIQMGADGGARVMIDADTQTVIYGDDDNYITISGGSGSVTQGGDLRMSLTDEGLALESGARVNDIVTSITADDDTHLVTEGAIKTYVDTAVSGSNEFTELTDTPSAYTSAGTQIVAVNSGETALEFLSGLTYDGSTLSVTGDVSATNADFSGNVGVSGTFGFDAGTTVTEIATSMDAPGDDNTLLTEAGIWSWVNTVSGVLAADIADGTFLELTDTPAAYNTNEILFYASDGVTSSGALTFTPNTGFDFSGNSSEDFQVSIGGITAFKAVEKNSEVDVYVGNDSGLLSGTHIRVDDSNDVIYGMPNGKEKLKITADQQSFGDTTGTATRLIHDSTTSSYLAWYGKNNDLQLYVTEGGSSHLFQTGSDVNDFTTAGNVGLSLSESDGNFAVYADGDDTMMGLYGDSDGSPIDQGFYVWVNDDTVANTKLAVEETSQTLGLASDTYLKVDQSTNSVTASVDNGTGNLGLDLQQANVYLRSTYNSTQDRNAGLHIYKEDYVRILAGDGSNAAYEVAKFEDTQISFAPEATEQMNINTSGMTLSSGTARVNEIVTSITADDDTHLVTEGAVYDYVADQAIWELVDTPTDQIRPKAAYLDYGIYTEGNVVIGGNLTVTGTLFYSDTETVQVADNIMVINYGESGAGVTAGEAGLQVDRGSETDYLFVYDEGTNTFRVGVSGSQDAWNNTELQPVATREDQAIDMRVPWWDASGNTFRTQGDTYVLVNSGTKTLSVVADTNTKMDITEQAITMYGDGDDYVKLDSSAPEFEVSLNGTNELDITTEGVQLAGGARVDDILNVTDGDSIDSSSTDKQLATAALRYNTISGAGMIDGTPDQMFYVDNNGDMKATSYMTFDADGTVNILALADDTQRFGVAADTSIALTQSTDDIVLAAAGTTEMTVDTDGMSLKSGASVNEILASTDTLDASSTDDQLATAKLIYDEISTISGTVGALTWLDLTDTPSSYTASYFPQVNGTGDGIVLVQYVDHNTELSSLQGGNGSDEYYHMTSTEYSSFSVAGGTWTFSTNMALASGTSVNEIVTTVDGSSTDDQLPTAGAVYDLLSATDTFIELPDTPAAYAGSEGYLLTVSSGGDAVIFDNSINELFDDVGEPTGFVNLEDSDISLAGTTFTISGTSFDYYIDGTKYTKTGAHTVDITAGDSSSTTGMKYIYFDGDTLKADDIWASGFLPPYLADVAYVAAVYYRNGEGDIYMGDERHGIVMDAATHYHLHTTVGTAYVEGLTPAPTATPTQDGSSDTHATLSVTAGKILDEDIQHDISATATPAVIPVFYKDGGGSTWNSDTAASLFMKDNGTRLTYNNATLGTQVDVGENNYVLYHIFATNDPNRQIVAVQGQASYSGLTAATQGAQTELASLQTEGLPFQEFLAIATFVYQTSTGFSNTKSCRIVLNGDGNEFEDWRTSNISPVPGTINDHGALTGLQDQDHSASAIYTDTSNFDGALTSSDDDVQKALETLDDAITAAGHMHYETDLSHVSGDTWSATLSGTPATYEVFLNGLKNRKDDADYYTATISGSSFEVEFAYDTYDTDWVNVSYTVDNS